MQSFNLSLVEYSLNEKSPSFGGLFSCSSKSREIFAFFAASRFKATTAGILVTIYPMSLLDRLKHDPLLGRVLRSSAHLFTSNTISLGLSVVMGALAIRLLGADGLGLITVVMGFASTVNSILSFRMSELVVRYGGEYLEKGEKQKAAALIKAAALTETAVSVLAFVAVLILAGWAARTIAKTPDTNLLFIVFGLGLLANFNTETSTGILQVTGKIHHQGTITLI